MRIIVLNSLKDNICVKRFCDDKETGCKFWTNCYLKVAAKAEECEPNMRWKCRSVWKSFILLLLSSHKKLWGFFLSTIRQASKWLNFFLSTSILWVWMYLATDFNAVSFKSIKSLFYIWLSSYQMLAYNVNNDPSGIDAIVT